MLSSKVCIISQKHNYYHDTDTIDLKNFLLKLHNYIVNNASSLNDINTKINDTNTLTLPQGNIYIKKILRTPLYAISNETPITNENIKYLVRKSEFEYKIDIIISLVVEMGYPFFMETFAIVGEYQIIEWIKGYTITEAFFNKNFNKNLKITILFQACIILEIFYTIFNLHNYEKDKLYPRDMHDSNFMIYEVENDNNQKFIINNKTFIINTGKYRVKMIDISTEENEIFKKEKDLLNIDQTYTLRDFSYLLTPYYTDGLLNVPNLYKYDYDRPTIETDRMLFLTTFYNDEKVIKENIDKPTEEYNIDKLKLDEKIDYIDIHQPGSTNLLKNKFCK